MVVESEPAALARRLTSFTLIALCVALPVLLAFSRIAHAPSPGELERLSQALAAGRPDNALLQIYYQAFLGADAAARITTDPAAVVSQARLAGMVVLLLTVLLIYLIVALVRGRATGLAACLACACLPAIAVEGMLLRPEQLACGFAALASLLIISYPLMRQRPPSLSRFASEACLQLAVGVLIGLAATAQYQTMSLLLVPAMAMLLAALSLGWSLRRAARRLPLSHWPLRAAARRYTPWMVMLLASAMLTVLVVAEHQGTIVPPPSRSMQGLLPESWWLRVPLLLLALLGGLRLLLGAGLRLGRLHRIRPDTLLMLVVAVLLGQIFLLGPGVDRLPPSLALACVLGDGAVTLLLLGPRWIQRLSRLPSRRRRVPSE